MCNALQHVNAILIWVQALHYRKRVLQVLLRRGGVRESTFRLPDTTFALFPTRFHASKDLLRIAEARTYHDSFDWDPKQAATIPIKSFATVCDCLSSLSIIASILPLAGNLL
jgi:hypothetical protein